MNKEVLERLLALIIIILIMGLGFFYSGTLTGMIVYTDNQEDVNVSIPDTFIQNIEVKNANFYDENNNGLVDKVELKDTRKLTTININSNEKERVMIYYKNGNYEIKELTKEEIDSLLDNFEIDKLSLDYKLKINLRESVPLIKADYLHNLQLNNTNITGKNEAVCILDTGIYSEHPNFAGRILKEYCYNDNDYIGDGIGYCTGNTEEYPDANDDIGHGTLVAGIVGSSGNLIGVAPETNLVIVKICNRYGECYYSDFIKGFEFCIANKDIYNISIISLSLGTSYTYDNYESCNLDNVGITNVVNEAHAKGIFIDIASGNSHSSTGISSPACLANVTSVGATTKSDDVASYSNMGPLLNVLAPGTSIYSTACVSSGSMCNPSSYSTSSGTSFAAPHVAGSAALLKQYAKEKYNLILNPDQIKEILKESGIIINYNNLNYSRIDLVNSINLIDKTLNESLDIWTDLNKNKSFYYYKEYLENITFYANLTKGVYIINGSICNLDFENNSYIMDFDNNKKIFEKSINITEFKDYNYSITCDYSNKILSNNNFISRNDFNFYLNHTVKFYVKDLNNNSLAGINLVIYAFNETNYLYNLSFDGESDLINITEFLVLNSELVNKTPHKFLVYFGNVSQEKELTINSSILDETSDNLFLLNISSNETQQIPIQPFQPSPSSGGGGGGSSTKKSTNAEKQNIVTNEEPQKFTINSENKQDQTRTLEAKPIQDFSIDEYKEYGLNYKNLILIISSLMLLFLFLKHVKIKK